MWTYWARMALVKTTLLRALTGGIQPDHGRCLIDGFDPVLQPREAALAFGYAPDGAVMEPHLRVDEYLRTQARCRLRGQPKQDCDRVLTTVQLTNQARQLVGTLSRGQKLDSH